MMGGIGEFKSQFQRWEGMRQAFMAFVFLRLTIEAKPSHQKNNVGWLFSSLCKARYFR